MRKFFITDIHGDNEAFSRLLTHVDFNPKYDQLIVGGDMIDRGEGSGMVLKRIKFLSDNYPNKVKAVIGNHEEMMMWYYTQQSNMWLFHGGVEAIQSFNDTFRSEREWIEHIKWAFLLPLYIEDDEYVYTHAGLNPKKLLNEQNREILWMTKQVFYQFDKEDLFELTKNRIIVHGHTPVEKISFDGVRLNCDMGSNSYENEEVRGLGLVNLTDKTYYIYRPFNQTIEERGLVL